MIEEPAPHDEMSFLAGRGEMARRIREFDWRSHPLGEPGAWPQALRVALGVCLHSAFPTAIYWGPELRLLYNDAWAPIPGPRHPEALGAPAREVWSDIWHVIEPQFERLLRTGEGLFVEDQMLPMRRFGVLEETYWNYSFTVIRGEGGRIDGIFNTGSETTRNVLTARRLRLLVELGDALRAGDDPATAQATALRIIGEGLGVDRAGLFEISGPEGAISFLSQWSADGVRPLEEGLKLPQFGGFLADTLGAGRSVAVADVSSDARLGEARAEFARRRIGAFVATPWFEQGALAGAVYLHSVTPRAWSDIDIATVEELLQRSRALSERAAAALRERLMMREVDHRARNALAVAHALVRLTRADDVDELRAKIERRIGALSRAHALLAAERWRDVDLRALVEEELAPYGREAGRSVEIAGPPTPLPPETAQTVALVIHELATNAAKHGALADAGGSLSVDWRVDGDGRLVIDWRERRAARATAPGPNGETGFGSTLLSGVVEDLLGGRLDWRLDEDGLFCRVELRLVAGASVTEPAETRPMEPGGTAPTPSAEGCGVMIVDDEALVALDLEDSVAALGHPVFGVYCSVGSALEALERGRPEIAILDVNLGGVSSRPIAERLAALDVPILLASGYQSAPELEAFAAGRPILSKPFGQAALGAAIRDALGGSGAAGD